MARLDLDNHAIAAMTHAQNLEPGHAPGWFNLGSVQQRSDMTQEAIGSYKRAVEVDPTYVKAAEKWADFAKEKGIIEAYLEAVVACWAWTPATRCAPISPRFLLQLAQGESDVMDHVAGLRQPCPLDLKWLQRPLDTWTMPHIPCEQRPSR